MKSFEYYYLAKRNLSPDALLRKRIIGQLKKGSRIHVSAVCGKAMASVACMLKDSGYKVTGSDSSFHPPMSDILVSHGIACLEPSVENLKNVDLVVIGNTLACDSLEVTNAREKNIPMMSGAEAVAQIFSKKRSLVVAGTHGKTTVSALLTHIFIEAGKDPAYMIGGVFQNSRDSYAMGSPKTKYVIYEGDEYNCAFFDKAPKFLRYNPASAILTSIEHDHFDLYPSFEDYKQSFQFLVDTLPKGGFLVVHESALPYIDLSQCASKVVTYGKTSSIQARFEITKIDSSGTTFSIYFKKFGIVKDIFVPMFGEYNIANATSAYVLAFLEGLPSKKILDGMKKFPGTKQRQEVIGIKSNDVVVIRDYAHHPTAVSLTLEGLRLRYPNKRLVAVFEPCSSTSRKKIFENDYALALKFADVSIVVSPTFKKGDNKSDFMDVSAIQKKLKTFGKKAYGVKDCGEALKVVSKNQLKNDVIVFMSSGNFKGIPEQFLKI